MNKTLMLKRIKEHLGFNKDTEFAKFLEIRPNTLSNWNTRGTFDAELLYTKCDFLNPSWLLTGKGPMLLEKKEDQEKEICAFKLRTDRDLDQQVVPLYSIEAAASLVELFRSHKDNSPIDTIRIPGLPKCDGAVFITGDSMYPLLKSGDIVAYKEINDLQTEIFWGEMYLISVEVAEEEFISVKYVQKSEKGEEYIKLVSQNQHHQPKDVQLSKVRAMALVKASIRINSMG
jgi:phage repressor protein C with HTH and peptisase S24 domain